MMMTVLYDLLAVTIPVLAVAGLLYLCLRLLLR